MASRSCSCLARPSAHLGDEETDVKGLAFFQFLASKLAAGQIGIPDLGVWRERMLGESGWGVVVAPRIMHSKARVDPPAGEQASGVFAAEPELEEVDEGAKEDADEATAEAHEAIVENAEARAEEPQQAHQDFEKAQEAIEGGDEADEAISGATTSASATRTPDSAAPTTPRPRKQAKFAPATTTHDHEAELEVDLDDDDMSPLSCMEIPERTSNSTL